MMVGKRVSTVLESVLELAKSAMAFARNPLGSYGRASRSRNSRFSTFPIALRGSSSMK